MDYRTTLLTVVFILFVSALVPIHLYAEQTPDPREVDRAALRQILTDIEGGINQLDLNAILQHMTDQAIVTYQNAEVTQGKNAIREYFDKYFFGESPVVKKLTITAKVSAPAVFYDDTAVAFGTSKDTMVLNNGTTFNLDGSWSATILKQPNGWRVASLHFSTNVLDNAVLSKTKQLVWISAIVSIFFGMIVGLVVSMLRYKKR